MTTTTDNTSTKSAETSFPTGGQRSAVAGRHRVLWTILAAGALVRVAALLWFGNPGLYNDEQDYNELAISIVERGEYGFRPGVLTSLRPPLYPAVLAGVYKAFGVENWTAVRVLQAGISLITVWLVYQMALALYPHKVANWAAGLTCFYPSLIAYNSQILTETLFTCLLCASLLAVIFALQRNALGWWLAAGIFLGLGALTRSILWLSPPFLALFVVWYGSGGIGRRMASAAVMTLAFAAILAPWTIRNSRLQETFITVDVMGGRNLMMGNYEHTPMLRAWDAISIDGDRSWHHVLRSTTPEAKGTTQGQLDKLAMKAGLKYMAEHPVQTAQRSLVKFINFWQLEREVIAGAKAGNFGAVSIPALLAMAALVVGGYVFVVMTGLFGIACAPPRDWRMHVLLVMSMGFVCGIHTLTFGHSRYHVPLIPLVSLYSAAAICSASEIWSRRQSWQFVVAAVICLLLVASWGWEFVVADSQKVFG